MISSTISHIVVNVSMCVFDRGSRLVVCVMMVLMGFYWIQQLLQITQDNIQLRKFLTQQYAMCSKRQTHKQNYCEVEILGKKKIRKTMGNEDQDRDFSNNSICNMSSFYSPPKTKHQQDLESLREENRKLREQVRVLKLMLDPVMHSKNQNRMQVKVRKQPQTEAQKLKKIIEKSYYSIKQMQTEIIDLKWKFSKTTAAYRTLEKKYSTMELQKKETDSQAKKQKTMHLQEVDFLHERIRKLETLMKQLGEKVEQQNKRWGVDREELSALKKFYMAKLYK